VVPVRDNPSGIERVVRWWSSLQNENRPRELIVVDDGSRLPVAISALDCRLLRTEGLGPAAARNLGWRAATSDWVAFLDSDCLPNPVWPASFASGWDGEIAVQGRVRPLGDDALSRFYDTQGILRPMAWTADGRPRYLITANALVWRHALAAVGGFDESFQLAAGEDVDLGLRLGEVGAMRWCADACVAHDFEVSLFAFIRRFLRYGRGNRTLASRVGGDLERQLRPQPFRAQSGLFLDHALALLAFAALASGWYSERSRLALSWRR
jgi:glycosyltransferase involved in cell wall biosynthesis